jgi:hypothetical protein
MEETMHKRLWHRVIGLVVVLLAATVISLVGPAEPASASAYKCAASTFPESNCLGVRGSGLYVSYIQVQHHMGRPGSVCNWRTRFNVYLGGRLVDWGASPTHWGCTWYPLPAAWTYYVRRNYPDRSTICGYFYKDNGVLTPGYPCVGIHR